MKKGLKVLSTAGLAAVFAASVGVPTQAAVIDRVLEDTAGTVYQYDEVALGKSYTAFIVNEDSKGAALYKHYLNNIKNNPNAFVAFNDDKAGYVTYESVQKAFNKSIVAGEDFNLDNYTESGEGVTAEVKNYVNVTVGEDGAIVETPVTPPVEEVTVQSVSAINDITVDFGTAVEEVELPATVTATFNDEAVEEVELNVDWDASEDYNANAAGTYTFTGTVTVAEDAEYTISEEVAAVTVSVTVEAPTQAMIDAAVAAINGANAAGIIEALQSPVLGLLAVDEDLSAEYLAEISTSVTNTPARIQLAINRVNAQAAEDAEDAIEAEQVLIDAVNEALNFTELRAALDALEPGIKLAPGTTFNQLYFDAIDTNTTETKEQILEAINNVNVEQLTALVVKAETDLTQDAYDAAAGLVVNQDLLEEAVQTDLADRLAAVQTAIDTQALVEAVNDATDATSLAAALLDLQTGELIEGYTADYNTEYYTAFTELTVDPAFAKVSEIQDFVTSVNAAEAQSLIDAVNDAVDGTELEAALVNLGSPTGFNVDYVQELFLEVNGEKVYTDVESILEDFVAINLIAEINNANEADRAGVPDAVKAFVTEYGNDAYINLKADSREEVFGFFHVETMNTELKTAAEVQTALNTSVETYKGFLSGVNAATTTTEARAALQVWVDQAVAAYGDFATAKAKVSELEEITNASGTVTIEAATNLIEATEEENFAGFKLISEILTAANPV